LADLLERDRKRQGFTVGQAAYRLGLGCPGSCRPSLGTQDPAAV